MDRIEKLLRWPVGGCAAIAMADILHAELSGHRVDTFDWILASTCLALLLFAALGRIPAKASLAILSTLACWLAAELFLGCLMFDQQRTFAWYVWPPNYQCRVIPHELPGIDRPGIFSTNSLGLRGPELSADDEYRILCVGGSTTECFYQDDHHTWPHHLSEHLNTGDRHVWVGNAGRSGLNANDHVTLLTHLPEARLADCWVVLCGVNDMGQQLAGIYDEAIRDTWRHTFAYRRAGFGGRWQKPLLKNFFTIHAIPQMAEQLLIAWFPSGNAIQDKDARWYAARRGDRANAPKTDRVPDLNPMLDEYETRLRAIVGLAHQQRKRLVFLTQPALWIDEMPDEYEALCWSGKCPDGLYRSAAALASALEAYNERMRAVCRSEDVEVVDLAELLEKSTATFYDECHFNDSGSARVAEVTSRAIQPLMISKTPSEPKAADKQVY